MKSDRASTSQGTKLANSPHPGDAADLSDLYASVIGSSARSKLTLAVAQKIEESLIAAGWPAGSVFGSRETLTHQYGVGRDVLREVFRVLEARDSARALRGRHGGLEVIDPSEDQIHAILHGYAYVSMLDRREVIAAWITVNAVAIRLLAANGKATGALIQHLFAAHTQDGSFDSREFCRALIRSTESRALFYLSDCVLSLLSPASRVPLDAAPKSLRSAMKIDNASSTPHIARKLRHMILSTEVEILRIHAPDSRALSPPQDLSPGTRHSPPMNVVCHLMSTIPPREWARGCLLGNEMELSERLNIDRSVVRQAIRIMEDAETATAVEGRGHGLITRTPSSGPLSRRLCALFVSRHIPPDDAEAVFEALTVELAGLAARRATAEDLVTLKSFSVELAQLESGLPTSALHRFERAQHQAAHNPLLCLFVDSIKAFLSWGMNQELHAPAPVIAAYKEHTLRVFAAICTHDSMTAAHLEYAKLAALKECREQFKER